MYRADFSVGLGWEASVFSLSLLKTELPGFPGAKEKEQGEPDEALKVETGACPAPDKTVYR